MDCNFADSTMQQLCDLLNLKGLTLPVKQQVQMLQVELKFIQLFFSCLSRGKDADQSAPSHLGSLHMDLVAAGQGIYEAGYFAILGIDVKKWEQLTSNLKEKVGLFKPEIRKICVGSFDFTQQSKPSLNADGILEFIDSILVNIKDLAGSEGDGVIHIKKQIEVLEEKLTFVRNFLDYAAKYCNRHHLVEGLLTKVQSWANDAACLALVYWVDGTDELADVLPQMNIMPCTPEVSVMFLELMTCSESSGSDTLLRAKIVVGFVDVLLYHPMDALKDHIETLREGLTFCLSFLMDPLINSAEEVGDVIYGEVHKITVDLTRLICSVMSDESILILNLLQKLKTVQAEVRRLHVPQTDSSEASFPTVIGMGFIDKLLDNLEEISRKRKFFPLLKVVKIQEELTEWGPFLNKNIVEQQNEGHELKLLRRRIMNVAYQVESVISSCLGADCRIWFDIVRFADVLEEIEFIRSWRTQNTGQSSGGMSSSSAWNQPSEGHTSEADDHIVGLKDEAEKILQMLKADLQPLHVVSIVGMPGVGKSTLAKKVYSDPSVPSHFSKHARCFVSHQAFNRRDLLVGILKEIISIPDAEISDMEDNDIGERLWKSLKGERYLIVMDNINSDTRAWDAVKRFLPVEGKRSRILFTTQNSDLANQTELSHENYPLHGLSPQRSWEFLKEKLFGSSPCPETLADVGNRIAISCKGLPLALAVTAGLLKEKKTNPDWWTGIEKKLASGADDEGYMKTLDLSYEHLPESSKPCFLYLGAFGKGDVISVRKLATLWIAEGFVERKNLKSSEMEGRVRENLDNLVNRNLVIATKRSSNGGIKACRVHDLLWDLCIKKAKKERFLHTVDGVSDPYRLCVYKGSETLSLRDSSSSSARSFLLFANDGWNQSNSDSLSSHFLQAFKFVQVVDLGTFYWDRPFPEEIFLLNRLRYLAIQGRIRYIPSSVSRLWNLENLIVKASESFVHVPVAILKMKTLKHVEVSPRAVFSLSDVELEELPHELDHLESFSCLSLYHGEDTEKLLRRLSGIRRLRCVFIESQEYTWKEIQLPHLDSLNHDLESLKLSAFASNRQVFCSWMRIQFPRFSVPCKLKKLTLHSFGLPWKQISSIAQLQHLEVLKLRDDAFRGKVWEMEDGEFQSLMSLELSNLNLEQWSVPEYPFPSLAKLVIGDCNGLEEIPSEFGKMNTMEMIELRRCSMKVRSSAKHIRDNHHSLSRITFEVSYV